MNRCLIIGLEGLELTAEEAQILQKPAVAGVILFKRNYQSRAQLKRLTADILSIRSDLIISVDQEGGRVQRFRPEFTSLPSMHLIGLEYDQDKNKGLALARQVAQVMAHELRECGVTHNYAPVADLYEAQSRVIADRAFHADPGAVSELVCTYFEAMKSEGLKGVAKHFPGHGSVLGDTHQEKVIDARSKDVIFNRDIKPFKALIQAGIDGILTSHVQYPKVDNQIASFSTYWVTTVLRQELGYQGLIFSDDLGMRAAQAEGGLLQLVNRSLQAGCTHILICNDPHGVQQVLQGDSQ